VNPHYYSSISRDLVRELYTPFLCLAAFITLVPFGQPAETKTSANRIKYRIEIDVDYSGAAFKGRQWVHFVNSTREDLEHIDFHLYPNIGLAEEDETPLTIQTVSDGSRDLKFSLRSRRTVLRVDLPAKLPAGRSIEITLGFSARIPRVLREETSLLAHFLYEVNDAVNSERRPRDARDIFFAGDEAMLLGYFYPLVAVRQSQSPELVLGSAVNGIIFTEVADYEVKVNADDNLTVIASGERVEPFSASAEPSGRSVRIFRGESLRGFALALVKGLKVLEQQAGETRVFSYFHEGDEKLGKRALAIAVGAVETYTSAFGDYPYPQLHVIEFPLPAGYSGVELPSLMALAQAYYIDFDAPQASRLPGVLREQADLIKSSFEFTLANGIAHQWWGGAIGSDSERSPYMDESLATFAAAYYHEAIYGKQLGDRIIDRHLRGGYQAYRMLGGVDLEVDKPAREFKSAMQYTAIVQAKGALLFVALRKELGDERFFNALRYYYKANKFRIATPDHLRYVFLAAADDPREVRSIFQHWLKEKHGDEDLGSPDLTLLQSPGSKRNSVGKFFSKIGRTAARPF
jgi:Peptidase family M1 domain